MAAAEAEQSSAENPKHVAERVKLFEANIRPPTPTSTQSRHSNNNIQHVAPVGVIIVLCTLYLTTTALQRNYGNYRQQEELKQQQTLALQRLQHEHLLEMHNHETNRRTKILEKLLEYKDLCTDLEIFTKDLRWIDEFDGEDELLELEDVLQGSGSLDGEQSSAAEHDAASETDSTGVAKVRVLKKHKLQSKSQLNGQRNGQRHNNKSMKIKNSKLKHETLHKKIEHKKNSTAEPIIYLFALVFIYLLLKAASDINQHYKSQAKGDKRLRRCSLQSYAQTHKQDRRASKDSPKKPKQLLMESRSKSVDRYHDPTTTDEYAAKKSEILANLRKYTSLDEQTRFDAVGGRYTPPLNPLWDSPITSERRQSGESIGTIAATNVARTDFINTSPNRRCSVPVSLNYQRQKLGHMPLVPISNTDRRTSIAGGHIAADVHGIHGDYADVQFPEVKRRVRMINRH